MRALCWPAPSPAVRESVGVRVAQRALLSVALASVGAAQPPPSAR